MVTDAISILQTRFWRAPRRLAGALPISFLDGAHGETGDEIFADDEAERLCEGCGLQKGPPGVVAEA